MQKILLLGLLFMPGILWSQTDTLWQESFETDGNGSRYTLSALYANDGGGEDYFERGTDTDLSGFGMDMAPIAGEEGSYYLGFEDMDATGISGSAVTITFNDVTITNYEQLDISFRLAANEVNKFDYATRSNGDYVLVVYAIDGGSYDTLALYTTATNASSQRLEWDMDKDGFGDSLTSNTLTTYSFAIPETGSTLSLQAIVRSDAGDEEIALDQFMVRGDPAAVVVDTDSEVLAASSPLSGATWRVDTLITEAKAQPVLAFRMQDMGTADGLATEVSTMVFRPGIANTAADWSAVIADAQLWAGGAEVTEAYSATVNPENITLNFTNEVVVGDGTTSGDYTLYVWLKDTSAIADGDVLSFVVASDASGFGVAAGGSTFATPLGDSVAGPSLILDVEATAFVLTSNTSPIIKSQDFELTVTAVNDAGAIDTAAVQQVTLELTAGAGNLSSLTGLTQTLISGTYTWNDLVYDAVDSIIIRATHDTYGYNQSTEKLGVVAPGSVASVLFTESFETDGSGSRYSLSSPHANDGGGEDYFERGTDADFTGLGMDKIAPIDGEDGSYYLGFEDMDAAGISGGAVTLDVEDISVFNHDSLKVSFLLATNTSGTVFDYATRSNGDYVLVSYSLDGAAYDTLAFFTAFSNASSQPFGLDTDGDAFGDQLTTANFTQYSFLLPKSGTSLDLRVQVRSDAGEEEIAFDHLVVQGKQANTNDLTTTLVAAASPVTASSLLANTATDAAHAQSVYSFAIQDGGGSDGLPTEVLAMKFVPADTNTISDWTNVLAGAQLYLGGSEIASPYTVTIEPEALLVQIDSANPLLVADGTTSADFEVKVWLQDTSLIVDRSVLALALPTTALGWGADTSGSGFVSSFANLQGQPQPINVVATALSLAFLTDPVWQDSIFSVSATAINPFGAVDVEEPQAITLSLASGAGTLSAAKGLTQNLIGGTYTWDSLSYDANGKIALRANHNTFAFFSVSDTLLVLNPTETSVFFATDSLVTSEDSTSITLTVNINSPDGTTDTKVLVALVAGDSLDLGSFATDTLTFLAGQSSPQSVTVSITDDAQAEGNESFWFALQQVSGGNNATAVTPDSLHLTVQDNERVFLNEIDADQAGSDAQEFVELYDGGAGNFSLDGYVLVFYNGSNDQVTGEVFDLDGFTTDAEGYFVIGSTTVPNVDVTFGSATNNIQNGADAVALYFGLDAADFPSGTPLNTSAALVDALVYDTDDDDDAELAALLLGGGQVNENGLGEKSFHSLSRLPNAAGGLRESYQWSPDLPTPGEPNVDNFGPALVDQSPFAGQDAVAVDTDLVLTFSEPIQVNVAEALLLEQNLGSGFEAIGTFLLNDPAVTVDQTELSVNLPLLDSGAAYRIRLDSSAISDLSGNQAKITEFTFFTVGTLPSLTWITNPFQGKPVFDFGRVPLNTADTLKIRLVANGLKDGTGTVQVSLSGADRLDYQLAIMEGDSLVSYPSLSLTSLDSTGSVEQDIWVIFNSTTCGPSGPVSLSANAENAIGISAQLQGAGVGPSCKEVVLSDALVNFGITFVGDSHTRQIKLDATGVDSLRIIKETLGNCVFGISGDSTSFNCDTLFLQVLPSTQNLWLSFTPDTLLSFQSRFRIESTVGDTLGFITVVGKGEKVDSILTIAEARTLPLGTRVTIAGTLTAANQLGGPAFMQDSTAGIAIFWPPLHKAGQIGDSVVVSGPLATFNDLLQISGDSISFSLLDSASVPVTPAPVSGNQLSSYEGQLVTLRASFDEPQDLLYPNSNYALTDTAGNGFQIRIDNDTDLIGRTRPQGVENITGIVGRFGATFQVYPRFQPDLPGTSEYQATGTSVPRENTLDIVSWNMEFFGSQVAGFGPTDKDLQLANARDLILKLDVDVIAVQEVADEQALQQLVNLLPGWERVCSDVWTRSYEPADPSFPPQKLCVLYNTATISITDTRVIFDEFYTQERLTPHLLVGHPGGSSRSFWSSGRLPYAVSLTANIQGDTTSLTLINLHAKSGASGRDIARKTYDADVLYDSLVAHYSGESFIILGDFNDDLDVSIDGSSTSPYDAFVNDTANFVSPTLALSKAGLRSTVGFSNVIDHQVYSKTAAQQLLQGSEQVYIPFQEIPDYGNTTSDHLPVITRMDLSPFEVHFARAHETVSEALDTIRIHLVTEPSPETTTVRVQVLNGFSQLGNSYESVNVRSHDTLFVNVPALATEATITLVHEQDSVVNGNDTLSFLILEAVGRTISEPSSFELFITDDDSSTISFDNTMASVVEGDTLKGGFTLSAALAMDVKVAWELGYISSTNSDVLLLADSTKVTAGNTQGQVLATITDDLIEEGVETFYIRIAGVDGDVSIGKPDSLHVTIEANDVVIPEFSFLSSQKNGMEGDTLVIPFQLDAASTSDISFVWGLHFHEGAVVSDVSLLSDSTTVSAGDTVGNVYLFITDDTVEEVDESFTLTVSEWDGPVTIGTSDSVRITIQANDVVIPNVSFALAQDSVSEGDTLSIEVQITNPRPTDDTRVQLFLQSGSDEFDGFVSDTVVFAAGSSASQFVGIPVAMDGIAEGDETYTFTLVELAGPVNLVDPSEMDVTIVGDEPTYATQVSFIKTSLSASENDSVAQLELAIVRPHPTLPTQVSVSLAQGTAVDLQDFATQTVTFPAGDSTNRRVTVRITDDTEDEDTEKFQFLLSAFSGSTDGMIGSDSVATLMLVDNDTTINPDTVRASFTAATGTVAESGGSVSLQVQLDAPADSVVTVMVELSSGNAGDIAGFTQQQVTFPVGNTGPQKVTISLTDNTEDEPDRVVVFSLTRPATKGPSIVRLGSPSQFSLTITDDDEVTGLSENELQDVKVFPNPVSNLLTIELPQDGLGQEVVLQLYTLQGKRVLETEVSGTMAQIATESLPEGMYMIQVRRGQKLARIRIEVLR